MQTWLLCNMGPWPLALLPTFLKWSTSFWDFAVSMMNSATALSEMCRCCSSSVEAQQSTG